MTRPAWLEVAWAELGKAEVPGPKHNHEIVHYAQEIGATWVEDDETPWCASFVGACLERSGQKSSGSMRARSYEEFGQRLAEPRVGAVVVFPRGSDPKSGHVGFVAGVSDTQVMVLGGNQGNKVSVVAYPKAAAITYRWPVEAKTPKQVAQGGSRIATNAVQARDDALKTIVTMGSDKVMPKPDVLDPLRQAADTAGSLKGTMNVLVDFAAFVLSHWWVAAVLLGCYFGLRVMRSGAMIAWLRADDENHGRHEGAA